MPIAVSGDPRAAQLSPPSSETNAPCGVVDLLDFPLNPPDGDGVARGGQDFGVFRRRYGKYHAGEDWWRSSGRSSLGAPVYSIGHGTVTYADPLGWGRDQGVVIVRHNFADGHALLSFYGHLDPESIVLRPGQCVARGDQLGKIGQPTTRPHLHFEIRTHMPYQPGTGYWAEDPTLAGWLPPSQTIWNERIASAPGVEWARSPTGDGTRGVGLVNGDTFVAIEDSSLQGIGIEDGALRWTLPTMDRVQQAVVDAGQRLIYSANQLGQIEAYLVPAAEGGDAAASSGIASEPLWTMDLDAVGFPTLMPLPEGGVVAAVRDQMVALSREGELLWEAGLNRRPFDWALVDGHLLLTTMAPDPSLWTIDSSGPVAWPEPLGGRLDAAGDQIWLLNADSLYRLDPETLSAERLLELPASLLASGDVVALAGGGALVAHIDRFDWRLIALDAGGTVVWERSVSGVLEGELTLFELGGRVYVAAQHDENASTDLSLFLVDIERAELTRLFNGGTRSSIPRNSGTFTAGQDLILINIGGGSLAAFRPEVAAAAVSTVTVSP